MRAGCRPGRACHPQVGLPGPRVRQHVHRGGDAAVCQDGCRVHADVHRCVRGLGTVVCGATETFGGQLQLPTRVFANTCACLCLLPQLRVPWLRCRASATACTGAARASSSARTSLRSWRVHCELKCNSGGCAGGWQRWLCRRCRLCWGWRCSVRRGSVLGKLLHPQHPQKQRRRQEGSNCCWLWFWAVQALSPTQLQAIH